MRQNQKEGNHRFLCSQGHRSQLGFLLEIAAGLIAYTFQPKKTEPEFTGF
ncbi:hypothetical protein XBFM1_2270002 [Xenorhabdus bovienii str. feltiae Moldova]|uniref:Uncharacterized protein n=1 Tax=Xenorhabdus bovienii str. feltiae Moldova TaxID=1398200 RepID=A0A077NSY1_XENBV|nr:hypothetical protein XBFM1_2270002 [Xenorhabdus bovienii str. feltiae Moldova]